MMYRWCAVDRIEIATGGDYVQRTTALRTQRRDAAGAHQPADRPSRFVLYLPVEAVHKDDSRNVSGDYFVDGGRQQHVDDNHVGTIAVCCGYDFGTDPSIDRHFGDI